MKPSNVHKHSQFHITQVFKCRCYTDGGRQNLSDCVLSMLWFLPNLQDNILPKNFLVLPGLKLPPLPILEGHEVKKS